MRAKTAHKCLADRRIVSLVWMPMRDSHFNREFNENYKREKQKSNTSHSYLNVRLKRSGECKNGPSSYCFFERARIVGLVHDIRPP